MNQFDVNLSRHLPTIAKQINKMIKQATGDKLAFSLIIFPAEEGGEMQYIGNCPRADAQQALESLLNSWKGGMPDIPAHEKH